MDPMPRRYSRRAVGRLLGLAALSLPAALRVVDARAATAWCRSDPVLEIDDRLAHVYISSPVEMLAAATDKIRLTVTVPHDAHPGLEDILADFGHGYDVRFNKTRRLRATAEGTPVEISVCAPARDGTLPVVVEFAPGVGAHATAAARGTANAWILLAARLP